MDGWIVIRAAARIQRSPNFYSQIKYKSFLNDHLNRQIVPALVNILDDTQNPRVQAHGAAALVNFSEECPKHVLLGYLDPIIGKLEQVLTSKIQEVYSLILCTVKQDISADTLFSLLGDFAIPLILIFADAGTEHTSFNV